jgi:hypothetical protein
MIDIGCRRVRLEKERCDDLTTGHLGIPDTGIRRGYGPFARISVSEDNPAAIFSRAKGQDVRIKNISLEQGGCIDFLPSEFHEVVFRIEDQEDDLGSGSGDVQELLFRKPGD